MKTKTNVMRRKVSTLALVLSVCGLMALVGCKKDDTSAPVVTLNGSSTVNVDLGGTFTDPGATATDDVDGDLSSEISVTGTVNANMSGSYPLTYTAADAAGNVGTASRTVVVAPSRNSYLGTFTASENCPPPYNLATTCTISAGSGSNQIVISLFYFNGGSLTLSVDGSDVTVDAGQAPNPLGESVTGTGTLNASGTVLTMNYTFTPGAGSPSSCTSTYTKN